MKKLDTYQSDLERLSEKFEEANLKVKSRDEVPIILEHIASIAGETGVKIDQIIPDSLGQELLTENNQRKYFDLPIYIATPRIRWPTKRDTSRSITAI